MPKTPSISEAEWKIMKLLWRKSPQPAFDLAEELQASEGMHTRTVKTLLSRLVKKGALGFKTYKNLYLYFPKHSLKNKNRLYSLYSFINTIPSDA